MTVEAESGCCAIKICNAFVDPEIIEQGRDMILNEDVFDTKEDELSVRIMSQEGTLAAKDVDHSAAILPVSIDWERYERLIASCCGMS